MRQRTYHKIDTCDKADALAHLIQLGCTREQLCRWFGISDRTLRWYLNISAVAKRPVGRPKKHPHPYH